MFVDSFSVGLDELPRRQITVERVLAILHERGRFSCFEASANPKIAAVMTALLKSDLIKSYLPEPYKGKPEPGGARAPDRDTYPWTFVRLTPAGHSFLFPKADGGEG